MRTGENNRDLTALEKKAGQKYARSIGRKFRQAVKRIHYPEGKDGKPNSGFMLKNTTARAKMRFNALESIALMTTPAALQNHFGFEDIKSNGVKMSLKPTDLIDTVFSKASKDVQKLADEISAIRSEEVTSKIAW